MSKISRNPKNDQNAPKKMTTTAKTLKITKIPLNPQNKQYTLEIIEDGLNIPKQSQNTLDFLDFWAFLVSRKLLYSFLRILWHFSNFCNVEVYILIMLDVWGILAVYEASRLDCSIQPFQGYFGHFIFFQVISVVLELLGYFGLLRGFRGLFFGHFVVFGVFWRFSKYNGHSSNFYNETFFLVKKKYFTLKNFQNIKKHIYTPKRLKEPSQNCQSE